MPDRKVEIGEYLQIGEPSELKRSNWKTLNLEDVKAGTYVYGEIRERGKVKSLILLHEEKDKDFLPPTCLKCWGQIDVEKGQVAITSGLFPFPKPHLLSPVENGSYFVYSNFGKIKDIIILDLFFNEEKKLCKGVKAWHEERNKNDYKRKARNSKNGKQAYTAGCPSADSATAFRI